MENENYYELLKKGKKLIKNNELALAEELFSSLINTPYELSAYYQLGKIMMRRELNKEARKWFSKLINTKYHNSASLEIAKIDVSEGKYDDARRKLKKLLYTKSREYALIELGKLEAKVGNFELAIDYFEQARNTKIWYYAVYELGRLSTKRGNLDAALVYYDLIKEAPNKFDAYSGMAQIHKKLSEYEKAKEEFKIAYGLKPLESINLEIAKLAVITSDYDEAREYFNKVKSEKLKPIATYHLIMIDIKEEKHLEAYELLKEAVLTQKISKFITIKVYLEYKLGLKDKSDLLSLNNYFFNQLVSYSKNDAIKRIKINLDENDRVEYTTFNENVDIEEIYKKSLEKIRGTKPYRINIVDKYMIDLGETVGTVNNTDTTKVIVTVLPNSHEILNIYPVSSYELDEEEVLKYTLTERKKDMLQAFSMALNELRKMGLNDINTKEDQDKINDELIKKLWHNI